MASKLRKADTEKSWKKIMSSMSSVQASWRHFETYLGDKLMANKNAEHEIAEVFLFSLLFNK